VTRARLELGATFRSLRTRNYRLFWMGQLVSVTGSWMQTLAIGWLVLNHLHASGTALGLVVAVQFFPMLVGGPWAGVIADRFDKRRILLGTQTAMAVLAAILAIVTLTDVVTLWMVFTVVFFIGVATMFDNPTRQSFVTEMVGPDDLANAVGLNSTIFNAARVVGPALAGLLILAAGTGVCFALNAVSFVAVIGGLAAMRPAELYRGAPVVRARGQIRDGLRYARSVPELWLTLGMVALIGTFTMNFTIILPLVAKVTFRGNAGTFGLLSALMGGGALVGALAAARRERPTHRLLVTAAVALAAAMAGAAVAPTLRWEGALIFLSGAAAITFMSTANATLQLNSRAEMRGRVMALYMVLFVGSTPIGGPIVGWIGANLGPRWSLIVGAAASLVAAGQASVPYLRRRLGQRSRQAAGDDNLGDAAAVA
jgi:MFS family permease